MKEIGATLATLIARVPIVAEVPRDAAALAGGSDGVDGTGFLSNAQVRGIGEYFVDGLCTLKHNGATRKLEQHFEAVCKRLLRQQDAGLAVLPQLWLQRVLAFLQRPGQTRSDIVRRSAGVPSAVVAICQAEPTGAAKRLLPTALRVLLDAARGPAASGEPWPLVHAYNCLRTVFESSALAMDAAAVFAEGIQISVHGMSAEEWEVCRLHRGRAVRLNDTFKQMIHPTGCGYRGVHTCAGTQHSHAHIRRARDTGSRLQELFIAHSGSRDDDPAGIPDHLPVSPPVPPFEAVRCCEVHGGHPAGRPARNAPADPHASHAPAALRWRSTHSGSRQS